MLVPRSLLSLLLLVGLGLHSCPPTQAQSISDLLPALTAQLATLWQNNELEFMGNTCYYSQRPTFRRWQLYFNGSFSCPGWTTITGKARTRSRSGVLTKTIENFLQEASSKGLVTEQEARIWLEGYSK